MHFDHQLRLFINQRLFKIVIAFHAHFMRIIHAYQTTSSSNDGAIMGIEAVSLELAGIALGLRNEQSMQTSRRGIADAIRKLVATREFAHLSTVTSWVHQILVEVGVNTCEAALEVKSVIDSLVLLGDLGIANAYGERILILPPRRFVALPDGQNTVLGGPFKGKEESQPHDDVLARRVKQNIVIDPVPFAKELGIPSFQTTLKAMGYQATNLHHLRTTLPRLLDSSSSTTSLSNIAPSSSNRGISSVLCGHIKGEPVIYKTADDGTVTYQLVPDEDFLSWCNLSLTHSYINETGQPNTGTPLPRQLVRAFLISGTCRPEKSSWTVNGETAAVINEWLGLEIRSAHQMISDFEPDPDQHKVIHAPSAARLLVEAGPGSGKTWVACARVAHLVQQGTAASRIWLLSFTRTAVEEIRQRITDALDGSELGSGVNIATFDSLAGRLRIAFGDESERHVENYEASILNARKLLNSDNVSVLDFLNQVEHIIIDEAQDLVGDRKQLVVDLLRLLSSQCGITVFADTAQAIYGYQEEKQIDSLSNTFLQILETDPTFEFLNIGLLTDHRTDNKNLLKLFMEARKTLTNNTLTPLQKYDDVRELIERSANSVLSNSRGPLRGSLANTMMLFRSRRGLLIAANERWKEAMPVRIHLSGRNPIIAPWLGITLDKVAGTDSISRQDFSAMWNEVWPAVSQLTEDDAWKVLRKTAGTNTSKVSITRLCDQLEKSPPLGLVKNYIGERGPLLSTIHGAKGREAGQVILMLPRRPGSDRDVDWEEEARVLFVGATRAKKSLGIGPGGRFLQQFHKSKRFWGPSGSENESRFIVEVGLDGDILTQEEFYNRIGFDLIEQEAHARRIWRLSGEPISARATLTDQGDCYVVELDIPKGKSQSPIAYLSQDFCKDLQDIADKANSPLPKEIRGFWINGARTVISQNKVTNCSRPTLAPILCGLASITFN